MGKLNDFFKRSRNDRDLMADLDALRFRMQKKTDKTLETYISELTEAARKHGIFLSAEDFVLKPGELDDPELAGVIGGAAGSNSLAALWLDLYDMQPGKYEGKDGEAKSEDR
jgi:hypothetical protein